MELNITKFMNYCRPSRYSGSVAELGKNAGKITWQNSLDCPATLITNEEEAQALKGHLRGFGAWEDEEIEAWTMKELNALMVQLVAGDLREGDQDGRIIYPEDTTEPEKGQFYYYLGE